MQTPMNLYDNTPAAALRLALHDAYRRGYDHGHRVGREVEAAKHLSAVFLDDAAKAAAEELARRVEGARDA